MSIHRIASQKRWDSSPEPASRNLSTEPTRQCVISAGNDSACCNAVIAYLSIRYLAPAKNRSDRAHRRPRVRRRGSKIQGVRPPASPNRPLIPSKNRFEKECTALQKDSKVYLDAIRGPSSTNRLLRNHPSKGSLLAVYFYTFRAGMASAQTRVADTIELFHSATDRTSDGALAANAYKRAVEDLDHSITRELVHIPLHPTIISSDSSHWVF